MTQQPQLLQRSALIVILVIITILSALLMHRLDSLGKIISDSNIPSVKLQYSYFFTAEHQTPAEALKQPFTPSTFLAPLSNYSHSSQWHLIELENLEYDTTELTLFIDNTIIDLVDIYEVTGESSVQKLKSLGEQASGNSEQQRALPHFHFDILANDTRQLLVHYQTKGTPLFPITVSTKEKFETYLHFANRLWGAFLGIVLVMCCYNLVLYVGIMDRTYLFYIFYIVSVTLTMGVSHGFGHLYFPEPLSNFLSRNIISLNTLVAISALQFALHFLRFHKDSRSMYQGVQLACVALLFFTIFSLFVPERVSGTAFIAVQILAYLVVARLVFFQLKRRFHWTKYYLISWLPFFIGAALNASTYHGFVSYNTMFRYSFFIAVTIEMALMSLALADRLLASEKQRLFHATHDFTLGFANGNMFENTLIRLLRTQKPSSLCILSFEFSNYQQVTSYLSDSEYLLLMKSLAHAFSEGLKNEFFLYEVDNKDAEYPYLSFQHGEIFSFIVRREPQHDLNATLNKLCRKENFNPIQDKIPYRVECHCGVAFIDSGITTPGELLSKSRQAISQAKHLQTKFWIYTPNEAMADERKVRLAQDLDIAIQRNSLSLHFQPQLSLSEPMAIKSEVLLRWYHPSYDMVDPQEFIEVAENTGLINRLTPWVIEKSCHYAAQLSSLTSQPISISINISAHDLSKKNFADNVISKILSHRISPSTFTFELTESTSNTNQPVFNANIKTLSQAGFKLAIDDFGTGYSSLSYVSQHPFTELKIDRSFVRQLLTDEKYKTVIAATIKMAKQLGLSVTAEGVEHSDELKFLQSLECDTVQGYLFAKPMSFDQYRQWLADHHSNVTNQLLTV